RPRHGVGAEPAVLLRDREPEEPEGPHLLHDLDREGLALIPLGGARRDLLLGELADERSKLLLLLGQVEVHTGSNPSRSRIDAVRSGRRTARTRPPMSAVPRSLCNKTVSAPSSRTSANVRGGSSGVPSMSRRATVHDATVPSGPH